MPRAGHPRRRR